LTAIINFGCHSSGIGRRPYKVYRLVMKEIRWRLQIADAGEGKEEGEGVRVVILEVMIFVIRYFE
jgi:hypothetical protein